MRALSRSSVVINHRVFSKAGGSGTYRLDGKDIQKTINYVARLERHESRGGLDREITQADRELTRLNDIISYSARENKFEGKRAQDMPMEKGGVSGGCWGQFGLLDESTLAQEILSSGSNLVRSIVSVPRSVAPTLDLTTKASWQNLLRTTWTDQMEGWGISRQNIRWAAFMHVDNPKNLHVHVLSWDASGAFSGAKTIPHAALVHGNDLIREKAFGNHLLQNEIEKDAARTVGLYVFRSLLGMRPTNRELASFNEALRTGGVIPDAFDRSIGSTPLDKTIATDLKNRVCALLPKSGVGYVQFGSLPKSKRDEVIALVRAAEKASPALARACEKYMACVRAMAEIKKPEGRERAQYISAQTRDYDRRCANVLLKSAARTNNPIDRELSREADIVAAKAARVAAITRKSDASDKAHDISSLAKSEYERTVQNKEVAREVSTLAKKAWEITQEHAKEEGKKISPRAQETLTRTVNAAIERKIKAAITQDLRVRSLSATQSRTQACAAWAARHMGTERLMTLGSARKFERAIAKAPVLCGRELSLTGNDNIDSARNLLFKSDAIQRSIEITARLYVSSGRCADIESAWELAATRAVRDIDTCLSTQIQIARGMKISAAQTTLASTLMRSLTTSGGRGARPAHLNGPDRSRTRARTRTIKRPHTRHAFLEQTLGKKAGFS